MRTSSNALPLIAFATLVLFGGCATNYSFREVIADIHISGAGPIGVAVHEQRYYVKSGKTGPDFVGPVRGGFGNPLSRSTLTGHPLADDMADAIATSLARKGFKAVPVPVSYVDGQNVVLEKMKATKAARMMLLSIHEWKSDVNPYKDVTLAYDLNLNVYDGGGTILAERRID